MKELALIGPSASGKSALAIGLASQFDALLLSIDSLALYREIDIASAKPTKEELLSVKHFGIDEIDPDEHFNAALFFDLYKNARSECKKENKNLIIVGGTGFYLYALTNGLSDLPAISKESLQKAKDEVADLSAAYEKLCGIDPEYAKKYSSSDTYRIQKGFEIFFETKRPPSDAFASAQREPLCPELKIFEIETEREILREKIKLRTAKMFDVGLIDEVKSLVCKYGREPKSMNSIGISEILDMLDGKSTIEEAKELISIHTSQLAKRQETFNKSKFKNAIKKT